MRRAAALLALALASSACSLRWETASTERARTATDCLYLEVCRVGPNAELPPGLSCAEALPTSTPPAGFVAPPACDELEKARKRALEDIRSVTGTKAKPAQVLDSGGAAGELKRSLRSDRKALVQARKAVEHD